MLQHPPEEEVLRICARGLDTARAGTEQIRSAPDLVEINSADTYLVEPLTLWLIRNNPCTRVGIHTCYQVTKSSCIEISLIKDHILNHLWSVIAGWQLSLESILKSCIWYHTFLWMVCFIFSLTPFGLVWWCPLTDERSKIGRKIHKMWCKVHLSEVLSICHFLSHQLITMVQC